MERWNNDAVWRGIVDSHCSQRQQSRVPLVPEGCDGGGDGGGTVDAPALSGQRASAIAPDISDISHSVTGHTPARCH